MSSAISWRHGIHKVCCSTQHWTCLVFKQHAAFFIFYFNFCLLSAGFSVAVWAAEVGSAQPWVCCALEFFPVRWMALKMSGGSSFLCDIKMFHFTSLRSIFFPTSKLCRATGAWLNYNCRAEIWTQLLVQLLPLLLDLFVCCMSKRNSRQTERDIESFREMLYFVPPSKQVVISPFWSNSLFWCILGCVWLLAGPDLFHQVITHIRRTMC